MNIFIENQRSHFGSRIALRVGGCSHGHCIAGYPAFLMPIPLKGGARCLVRVFIGGKSGVPIAPSRTLIKFLRRWPLDLVELVQLSSSMTSDLAGAGESLNGWLPPFAHCCAWLLGALAAVSIACRRPQWRSHRFRSTREICLDDMFFNLGAEFNFHIRLLYGGPVLLCDGWCESYADGSVVSAWRVHEFLIISTVIAIPIHRYRKQT